MNVLLAAEKATIQFDPALVDLPMIRKAVAGAGYKVPESVPDQAPPARTLQDFTRPVLTVFGIVFGVVLFVVVFGEWLGWFEKITALGALAGRFRAGAGLWLPGFQKRDPGHPAPAGDLAYPDDGRRDRRAGSRRMGYRGGRCVFHARGRLCREIYDRTRPQGGP